MSTNDNPRVRDVYGRLWQFVLPHKLIGMVAVIGMAATAVVEASLVYLLEPLTDEALVAHNLEASRWMPFAFAGILLLAVCLDSRRRPRLVT